MAIIFFLLCIFLNLYPWEFPSDYKSRSILGSEISSIMDKEPSTSKHITHEEEDPPDIRRYNLRKREISCESPPHSSETESLGKNIFIHSFHVNFVPKNLF